METDFSNIFIIGCPRSGTSALSWALAAHPQLWTSAESNILLYLFRTPWFHEQYELTVATHEDRIWFVKHKMSYTEFASYIGQGLDLMFRSRSGGRTWIDSTPAYTNVAPQLMVFFPQAKFIHIIRDGRAVVNSMLKSGFPGIEFHDFKRACAAWVHYVHKGIESMEKFPGRVLEIRHELLTSEPEMQFQRIYSFLGLDYCEESVTFIRTKRINSSYLNEQKSDIRKIKDPALMPKDPWKEWSSSDRKQFIKIAGATMESLGYPLEF